MRNMFQSATLKLTAWYLVVIMLISVTFSGIIYQISSTELDRGFPPDGPGARALVIDREAFEQFRQERAEEARMNLIGNLIALNVITLVAGGFASYFLARRTLSPIKDAVDAQARFTSDASHELRTPLAALYAENEIALRKKELPARRMRELLVSNMEEVDKLRKLSDRLLELSSEKSIPLSDISLEDVGIEAITRVVDRAQAKDIVVENALQPLKVRANLENISDLMVILIDNAVKYSPEKSTIRLTTEQDAKSVTIFVKDEGQGIATEDIPKIFDRFYRADASRNQDEASGYGLGLSIAQRIAAAHSTRVFVTSTVGEGSTFSFKLPLV